MSKRYFTFGHGMHDTHGRSLAGYYVVIDTERPEHARSIMVDHFGSKWSMEYSEETFAGQPERFGLQELNIDGVELCCGVEQKKFLEGHALIHELLGKNQLLQAEVDALRGRIREDHA